MGVPTPTFLEMLPPTGLSGALGLDSTFPGNEKGKEEGDMRNIV